MPLGGSGVSDFAYTSQSTVTGVSADGGVSGQGVVLSRGGLDPLALVWEDDPIQWGTNTLTWQEP